MATPKYTASEMAAQAEEAIERSVKDNPGAVAEHQNRSGMTKNGTVVPRPLGMNFKALPTSSAVATPSGFALAAHKVVPISTKQGGSTGVNPS